MRYPLDTNAVVAFVGKTSMPLVTRMLSVPFGEIGLPSIVVHDLTFGAYRSKKVDLNLSTLHLLTRDLTVVDFTADDARAAGQVRADLARLGTPIGPYDVLIAGQAKRRCLVLVTSNVGDFSRVGGLEIEDWTRQAG